MKKSVFSRVFKYVGRYVPLTVIALLLAIITVACNLYVPIIVGESIDYMIGEGHVVFSEIRSLLIKIGIVTLISAAMQWIMGALNSIITYNVARDLRNDAFLRLQRLPVGYIDSHKHGDVASRIVNDSEQFADGLLMGFTQLFSGVFTVIGTLFFMLRIDWKITLYVVVLTPVSLFVAKFIADKTHSMFVKRAQATGNATAVINETVSNQKVVKAFSNEEKAIADFEKADEELKKYSLRAIFFSSTVNPTTRFINAIIYAIVGLTGAFTVISGKVSVGMLSSFLSYASQYAKPFNEISGVITDIQGSLACASRIFDLIDTACEKPDAEDAIVLENARGDVTFSDVSFSYDPEKPLLSHISLNIKAGSKVAIVGPTGCGKTTLINLLMRFYDVCDGSIAIDGNDIRSITRESLRTSFGMVLQETWLSSGSIRENIAMGMPDAAEEKIINAATEAHAHSFIMQLKDGYDTVIGDAGASLSQGQKQLLCIARIMLTSPPMLILDEATSSIDTRTELKIQDAFSRLMHGKTSFIVAHRLSTIRDADVILVMNKGNIVEAGTHTELLAKGGFYAELYNSQFASAE